eukprot:6485618-Amphidinium_carterae.1
MVELLQLSCSMAERKRRDSDRRLVDDVVQPCGRLTLDPESDEENELLELDDDDWTTLWIDSTHPMRVQCGKVQNEEFERMLQSGDGTGRYLCAGYSDSCERRLILDHELPTGSWTGVILPQLEGAWHDDQIMYECADFEQLWHRLQTAVYGWHQVGELFAHLHPPSSRLLYDLMPRYDAPAYRSDVLLVMNENGDKSLRTSTYCWLTLGKRARHRKLDKEILLMSLYSHDDAFVLEHLLESSLTCFWTGQADELCGWPSSCARIVVVEGQVCYEVMKSDGESLCCGFGPPISHHVHHVKVDSQSAWSTHMEPLSVIIGKERRDALNALMLWARSNPHVKEVPDMTELSFIELCDLLEEMLEESTIPVCAQRTNLTTSTPGSPVRSLALGAYTTRGLGCTLATWRWLSTLRVIHALACHRPVQECYLSVSVNSGAVSWHVDHNESTRSWLLCVGDYKGGELQTCQETKSAYRQWIYFDASEPHRVLPVTSGRRWSVSLYTPNHPERLPRKVWRQLSRAGFPTKCEERAQFPELPTVPELEEMADEDEPERAEPVPLEEVSRQVIEEATEETPTTQQKAVIRRIHVNLGHPPLTELLRALRLAKVRPGLRLWVKNKFYCEECHMNKRPSLKRPSMLPRSYSFNRVIGIDCLEIKVGALSGEYYVNIICWGTRLQVVARIGVTLSAEAVLQQFLKSWVMHYGWPEQVICDQGSEFKAKFRDFLEWAGTMIHVIDSRSPHQNGRTERAGGLVKEQVQLIHDEVDLLTHDELEWAVCHAVSARNAYVDRSGFSSHQRVYGSTLRFPRDMLGDDHLSSDQLAISTKTDHMRAQDIRTSALSSLFRLEAKTRLARAARAKTRTNKLLPAGTWVFLLRRTSVGKSWREGPGLIIATAGVSAWISLHGEILKVAQEMLREATSEELRGIEEINEVLPDMKEEVELARRQRRYRDLTSEATNEHRHSEIESTHVPSSSSAGPPSVGQSRAQSEHPEPTGQSRRHSIASSEGMATPRSVRRRLEPGVAEVVRRLEGDEQPDVAQPNMSSTIPATPVSADAHMSALQFLVSMKKKTGDGVVESSALSPEEWDEFLPAIRKEIDSMININKGLTPMTLQRSFDIYNNKPDRVVKSRLMLRWKPVETETTIIRKPKARWIMLGHQDPDALKLEGRAPSPTLQAVNIFLNIAASRRWEVRQGDLAEAFLQGGPCKRELYITLPAEVANILGLDPRTLCVMEKEIYGSVLAPASWRASLVPIVVSLGWTPCTADECVFILKDHSSTQSQTTSGISKNEYARDESSELIPIHDVKLAQCASYTPIKGLLIILTDDILEAGDSDHCLLVSRLKKKFRFGKKYVSLQKTPGGGVFNGRRVYQLPSFEIITNMRDYIETKLEAVTIPKSRKKDPESVLTESERTAFRGVLQKVMWIAREARPDVSGTAAILARRVPSATVSDWVELQRAVKHLQETADIGIRFYPIPVSQMRVAVFIDGAPSTASDLHPQSGHICAVTTDDLDRGNITPINMVSWRSGKIDRVCASSLSSEAYSMVGGIASCELVFQLLSEMTNSDFSPCWSRERLMMWHQGVQRDSKGVVMLRAAGSEQLRQNLAITDAKSLYDALQGQARGKEPRIAIATAEAKQGMALLNLKPRWLPHNLMLSDPLTKVLGKCNAVPLLKCMRTGVFQLSPEQEHLDSRREEKSSRGHALRRKGHVDEHSE